MKKILLFILAVSIFTSCYTTWTVVGDYDKLENQMESYRYDHAKQFYLFGGLIPLGHAKAKVPNEPCEIKTKFKFVDQLVECVTLGVLGMRTTEVYALKGGSAYAIEQNIPEPTVSAPVQEQASDTKAKKVKETKPGKEKTSPNDNQAVSNSTKSNNTVSVDERRRRAEEIERQDAEAKAKEPKDEIPVTKFPEIQVGQTVMYRDKGQWHAGKIVELIMANSGEKAIVEISDGSTIERYLEDIQVIK